MKKYVALDFETGGLSPIKNAIVSVGLVILNENLEEIGKFYTLVNEKDKLIEDRALSVNGLNREEIKNGMDIVDVLDILKIFLWNSTIVCHNAPFDVAFLNCRGFNIEKAIDTLMISRKKYPLEKHKLELMCQKFSIPVKNTHNSIVDAILTTKVLRKLHEEDILILNEEIIVFKNKI